MFFQDRVDAGRQLAERLSRYANAPDVTVLALPRGGVPVGYEVATRLRVPLDVFLVRKLGVPGHPELAMGAVATGGVEVLSNTLIEDLGIPAAVVQQVAVRERAELDRHDRLFRADPQPPVVRDRTVILVDDGLATGASMEAAIISLRRLSPAGIVVAVPVGAPQTCEKIQQLADHFVCLAMPAQFNAVGQWYENFSQTTDVDVQRLLAAARGITAGPPAGASVPEPRAADKLEMVSSGDLDEQC